MSIESTEFLSKLPLDSLKDVHQKWPNPLIVLALFLGAILPSSYFLAFIEDGSSFYRVIGVAVAFFVMLFAICIYSFVKLSNAKKSLKEHAETHSLPYKSVLKEFKKNYPKMGKALKNSA